jgi:hypothetical protein
MASPQHTPPFEIGVPDPKGNRTNPLKLRIEYRGAGQYAHIMLTNGVYTVWKWGGLIRSNHAAYAVQSWEHKPLRKTRHKTCILCGAVVGSWGWSPVVKWPFHAKANRSERICEGHWSELQGYLWVAERSVHHLVDAARNSSDYTLPHALEYPEAAHGS